MTAMHRTELAALVALVATLLSGCGGLESSLSGVVKLDGEPFQAEGDVVGTVMLQPLQGNTPPATGALDGSGRYKVVTGANKGLPPGEYAVGVSAVRLHPPKVEGMPPIPEPLLPRHYRTPGTSGLMVTVEPGSNEYDIDLQSSPGQG